MTYTETVTSNGESATGTLTDAGALSTLRRGLRLGSVVTATKDGAITITRTALRLSGEDVIESTTVVTLRPDTKQPRLTKAQYNNLAWIRSIGERARLLDSGRVGDAFCQIPQPAAKRLLDRGLAIGTAADRRVEVGVAGLLAMAAFEHPVRTTAPRGWHSSDDGRIPTTKQHRRHPFQVPDYSSTAVCMCGFRRAEERRTFATSAARKHLDAALTAALIGA
jgi:nicotinamidase-related amidase